MVRAATIAVLIISVAHAAPASAESASAPASATKPAKAAAPAAEEGEREKPEKPESPWSLEASIGVTAGYNDNATITRFERMNEAQASATTDITAGIKPKLKLGERWRLALGYDFEQKLYYSASDLDSQTHSLTPSLKLATERVEATLSYELAFSALIPKNVFYSIEHEPKLAGEILIKGPFYACFEYAIRFYDIRDPSYSYLNGRKHHLDVYPELYFEGKLTTYLGFRLNWAKLGEKKDKGKAGGELTVPESYLGLAAFLHVTYNPHESVTLKLDTELGRNRYEDLTGQPPPGAPGGQKTFERTDTNFSVSLEAGWRFWRGFSISGYFSYEKNNSPVSLQLLATSYSNITGYGGLSWEYP
jgi:opacity protein-like surface antigen